MAESPTIAVSQAPKPKVSSSAAQRERGYTIATPNPSAWWTDLSHERTPELRWPLSVQVFDDMVRQDAQIASVLNAIATPIMRTGWRIDGTGCNPLVTAHVASDLGLPVIGEENEVPANRTRGRFSWTDHLATAVPDHLQYGHAVFEQVYYPVIPTEDGGDGMFHLRKLGYRPARSIFAWNIAPDGGLISVQQYAPQLLQQQLVAFGSFAGGPVLPVNRLVVYTNQRKGGNWVGQSALRPAYKNWQLKDRLLRVQTQVAERNGLGIPVHTSAGNTDQEIDAGLDIVEALRAGDNSGASLSHDATLEILGVKGNLPDIAPMIAYHDEQIARAVLAHFLNLGTQTGSWALGATFADFFTLTIQAVAENIRDTATKHIIEDLVDINYGPTEPAPRLKFDEIGSRQDSIIQALALLIDKGAIKPDEDLEQYIRSTLGLPPAGGEPLAPDPKTTFKEDAAWPST